MPTRERLFAMGNSRGLRLIHEFGEELRHARLASGLSQVQVAHASGTTQPAVSRLERGLAPYPNIVQAARVARILGLELSVRCYPAGGQLRDAAHAALIQRLLARRGPGITSALEVPIQSGDPRAWDAVLGIGPLRVGVIAETRIRDLQALLRREHLKQADSGVDWLILLVADTHHNRATLAEARASLAATFPLNARAVLTSLGRGEAPSANGIVIL